MNLIKILITAMLLVGCANLVKDIDQPKPTEIDTDDFVKYYESMVAEATEKQDSKTGWIGSDCDGMIWNGPYSASPLVEGVDIEAAEYSSDAGKFGRRPAPWCWVPEKEGQKQESRGEWSGDMAVKGLIPWAFLTGNLSVLEDHAEYGKQNDWFLGSPKSVETFYSPSLQGLLWYSIYALGGENNPNRLWPGTYKSGLKDFQAAIQMFSIWLRGEIQKKINEFELNDPVISQLMLDRINEHVERMPGDPFYQFVKGQYTGDMQPAIKTVMAGSVGDHVRCESGDCKLQYRIFAAGQILRQLGVYL